MAAGWVWDEPEQSFSRGSSQLIPHPAQTLGFALQFWFWEGKDNPQAPVAGLLFSERFTAQMRGMWEAEGAATLLPCALTQKKLLQLLGWGCRKDALMARSLPSSRPGSLRGPGAPSRVSSTVCAVPQTQQAGGGFSLITSFAFPSPTAPGFGIREAPGFSSTSTALHTEINAPFPTHAFFFPHSFLF